MSFPLVLSLAVPMYYFIFIIPLFMGLGFLLTTLLLIIRTNNWVSITTFLVLPVISILISPSLEILALTMTAYALASNTGMLVYYYVYIWRHKNKEK